ncbi:F5O11.16 [Arabidopsis thaliana]|uniref:F5O11.16 n=1 Tax=Arabidopsis thaliana TaxID=3702 RepID=Q9LNA3_ARATH|nr:F5O11.16 [Arabidopsis thaliana]
MFYHFIVYLNSSVAVLSFDINFCLQFRNRIENQIQFHLGNNLMSIIAREYVYTNDRMYSIYSHRLQHRISQLVQTNRSWPKPSLKSLKFLKLSKHTATTRQKSLISFNHWALSPKHLLICHGSI